MSDNNLTEKISETITNAFKKTKVFEKIGKIEIYIGSNSITSSSEYILNIIHILTFILYALYYCSHLFFKIKIL